MASFEIMVRGERRVFPVRPGHMVGRHPECDLVLPLPKVSRTHFSLTKEGNQTILWDRASRNGTYVNFQRVVKARLKPGDRVFVGGVTLTYIEGPEDRAVALHDTCPSLDVLEDSAMLSRAKGQSGVETDLDLITTPAPTVAEKSWMGKALAG